MRICRECGAKEGTVEFKKGKNLCRPCATQYMRDWKEANKEHVQAYRATPEFRKKRQESVSKCIQKSPEAFIRSLLHNLTKKSNLKKAKEGKLNKECLDVRIDYEYLLDLYRKQDGRCTVSCLPMTHEFNNLRTMSVDRIDSTRGYIPGNVQLVCQFVNCAKRHFSNDEIHRVLNEYFDERVRRRLAGIEHIQDLCRKEALVVLAAADKEIVASLAKAAYDRSPGFESD